MSPSSIEPNYVFGGLLEGGDVNSWGNFNYTLMIKTKKGADRETVLKKMQNVNFVNRTMKDAKANGQTPEEYVKENGEVGGRLGMLDRVLWTEDGWPYIKNCVPSTSDFLPVFNN